MPVLEPSVALETCENTLRGLIEHEFRKRYADNWLTHVASVERIDTWRERAEAEARSRTARGVAAVAATGLAYAQFFDLLAVVKKEANWPLFAPALGKRAETIALLDRFDSLRNAVAHGRSLVVFEQELLSGIVGQVRNQVTLYMSSEDPAGDHYPRIEFVTDSFGHTITSSVVDGEIAGSLNTDVVLRPGDHVVFTMHGTDPQGRALTWKLYGPGSFAPIEVTSEHGQPAELTWDVVDGHVTETAIVELHMLCAASRYHRFGSFDHRAYIGYVVRPPRYLT